jgi:hypothetical protein
MGWTFSLLFTCAAPKLVGRNSEHQSLNSLHIQWSITWLAPSTCSRDTSLALLPRLPLHPSFCPSYHPCLLRHRLGRSNPPWPASQAPKTWGLAFQLYKGTSGNCMRFLWMLGISNPRDQRSSDIIPELCSMASTQILPPAHGDDKTDDPISQARSH